MGPNEKLEGSAPHWVARNGPFLFVCAVTVAVLISDGLRPTRALEAAPALPPLTIAYAPESDLERIDVGLIGEARATIDVAAYVLTDRSVAEALERAAGRGVKVRVVVDSGAPDFDAGELLGRLAATAGVEVRIKPAGDLMHLKAYVIDGQTVRLGSANFSRSGETRQDNELSIVRSAAEAERFEAAFDAIWRKAEVSHPGMGIVALVLWGRQPRLVNDGDRRCLPLRKRHNLWIHHAVRENSPRTYEKGGHSFRLWTARFVVQPRRPGSAEPRKGSNASIPPNKGSCLIS